MIGNQLMIHSPSSETVCSYVSYVFWIFIFYKGDMVHVFSFDTLSGDLGQHLIIKHTGKKMTKNNLTEFAAKWVIPKCCFSKTFLDFETEDKEGL